MMSLGRGVSLGATLILVAATASAQVVPCTDPRGCPDLTVDAEGLKEGMRVKKQTFSMDDCAVREGMIEPGTHKILKFTTRTPNRGPGALRVGAHDEHPEWFDTTNCHAHPHFLNYVDYRLWTPSGYQAWLQLKAANPTTLSRDLLAANPAVAAQMIEGKKHDFCIIDEALVAEGADPKTFTSCWNNQGVGVGWANEYDPRRYGQWIKITSVPRGTYVLEVEVNPLRLIEEASYSNNAGSVQVFIR